MDSFLDAGHTIASHATTRESERHGAAHAGADLPFDTRPEPERKPKRHAHANINVDADSHAHAGALGESDAYPHTHAHAHAYGDVGSRHHSNGVTHSHAHTVAYTNADASACERNLVFAQRTFATGGRHGVSRQSTNGSRPADSRRPLQL
jgi:hypothetical protein